MRIIVTFLALCLAAVSAVSSISERIVGGELTTIDKYPSMVSILITQDEGTLLCGGTILNERSILTAGHCAQGFNPDQIKCRVGSSFFTKDGVVHDISNIMVHPSYEAKGLKNDVAILRAATTIDFTDVSKPVSIAETDYNLGDDEEVWAAGWGRTKNGGDSSPQLRHVQLEIINQTVCRERYPLSNITDNTVCAGLVNGKGRDTCQGDSGGPLYHKNVQVGVVSWGKRCGSRYPGIYARVSRFADWIKSNQ